MNDQVNPDMQLGVEFFTKSVELKAKSEEAGRPIHEDREFVRITFPADNKRELVAPAHEMHYVTHLRQQLTYADRFKASYDAFADNKENFIEGTPLTEAPFMTKSKIEELKHFKVRSVEQLAGMPDASMKRMGFGARDLRDRAQAYLAAAQGTSEVESLKARIAELEALQLAPAKTENPFEGFSDDDLKNMIRDAGGEVPKGNAKRETLVSRLNDIAAEKEDA